MNSSVTAESTPSPSLKSRLKQRLQGHPGLWGRYWRAKQQLKRLAMLRYFWHDIANTFRFMFWPLGHDKPWALSAELLFQYHKLEKGLVMPGKARLFGLEPASAVMTLMSRWESAGNSKQDPVFLGALETMRSYLERLNRLRLDPKQVITPQVSLFLHQFSQLPPQPALSTPYLPKLPDTVTQESQRTAFDALAKARRSVRSYKPDLVDQAIFEHAVSLAQLSPSACNRQPCTVILVSAPELRQKLLALQNGNKGFGHLAPHIAVITADERGFFDASERHEPYVDGGLFAMSFLFALQSHGVSSCCLNWCVTPTLDKAAHALLDLSPAKRIVMLMAIGWSTEDCAVPRSHRRRTQDIVTLQ